MLLQISDRRLASRAAESFVREIGRQAIICPSSMMAREVGYKGFHAAPVLSQTLFEDRFINRHYQPLSGLEFGDFTNVDRNMIDRLNHGIQSTLATVLDAGDYWGDRSLASMSDHFEQAARDVHRQIRADRDNYGVVIGIHLGLKQLIDDTVEHLDGLNREDYDSLYANTKDRRDFNVLDYLSEAIVEVLYSFANDFEGHEDAFWSTAIDIVNGLFGRFGDQPDGMDPLTMSDHFEQAARDVHRQIRADRDNYGVVIGIHLGLKQLIDDTVEHLDGLNREDYDSLYANTKDRRDFNVLDYLSEAIVEVLYSFANDFEGHEDAFWSTAIDIVNGLFGRFGDQPDGMDPLQHRVAIKFIDKVKENMDGWYPALTRVLLPVIGPYEDPANKNPNSAYSILRKAFYAELMRFPELYEKDPEKAGDFLPKNVRYDAKSAALVQIYLLGQERSTNLRTLSIEPVSFNAEAVRRERPADE